MTKIEIIVLSSVQLVTKSLFLSSRWKMLILNLKDEKKNTKDPPPPSPTYKNQIEAKTNKNKLYLL